jgi:uncharacterized protein RhaS with RHS repeats
MQRFISEDPIGFAGGDPNLYAYVADNPVNYLDPLGLEKGSEKDRSKCGGFDYATWTLSIGIPHTYNLLGGIFCCGS